MGDADTRAQEAAKADVDTPGPDSFQAPSIRRWITLSYWTIILLCIPYWWHSTTIERHTLPLSRIEQWRNRGPCPVHIPVSISITSTSVSQTSSVIDKLNGISRDAERCLVFSASSRPSLSNYHVALQPSTAASARVQGNSSAVVTYKDGEAAVTKLVDLFMPSPRRKGSPIDQFSQRSKAVKYAEKYKLVFSLLNEDASKGGILQWDAPSALEDHIYPLLGSLKSLHEYDVETQVQYLAPLVVQREVTDEGTFIVEDQLKVFVNSAEWNLGDEPVLHFILYVPASDKRPLYLKHNDGTTKPLTFFSIPQWGGVVVLNLEHTDDVDSGAPVQLTREHLQPAFAQFASLLRISHGIPALEAVGSKTDKASWEIQALMRERTVQNVREAVQKLGALARQVNEIQNMRIPKAVQEDVNAALDALASVESEDLQEAMHQSARAATHATRASFNHEMLAMLYFPDEHKWAVYTPLFGPIAVPLVVALLREIKEYKKRRREKLKKE